jgi:glycosyltransferase involved in cell wall biosynthesis
MQMPLVSVVIPTYNSATFLPETIGSILSQEFQDFEIVVVDDGSTDDTAEIVTAVESEKIRYLKIPNSGGPSKPRNIGIEIARGKYIALCDSDDVMLPGKLNEATAFLEQQPDVGFVFTNMILCHEDGRRFPGTFLDTYSGFWDLPKTKVGERWFRIKNQDAYRGLFYENYIGISGVVGPKQAFLSVRGFDEGLSPAADLDIFLRMSKRFDIGYLDLPGHLYRQRRANLTSQGVVLMGPDIIRTFRKQLNEKLSERLHKQARRRIAAVLFDMGYHYQLSGRMGQARLHYQLSLKERPSWRALRGVILSFVGHRLLTFLRDFRAKLHVKRALITKL